MKFINFTKFKFLTICFFTFFLFSSCSSFSTVEIFAKEFYISSNTNRSNDSNIGSKNEPWRTFKHAMTKLKPGDTLCLMDGIYTEKNSGTLMWLSSKGAPSGTERDPITIKALNDGQAFVNGKNIYRSTPFLMMGTASNRIHDINIEGIRFGNSSATVISIVEADRINVRRVSAFNASYDVNSAVIRVSRRSEHVLFEDCVAYGTGRTLYASSNCKYVTFRRCWGNWEGHSKSGGSSYDYMQIYGSDDCIIENCVAVTSSTKSVLGFVVWANISAGNKHANNNKFYGNVAVGMGIGAWIGSNKYNIYGNEHHHFVSIGSNYGFMQRADDNFVAQNLVIQGDTKGNCYSVDPMTFYKLNSDFAIGGSLKDSVLIDSATRGLYVNSDVSDVKYNGLTNTYNNYYNNNKGNWGTLVSQGTGEITENPSYDTATYGNGAYLMIPTALKTKGGKGAGIGAEVLYCYVNGVLQDGKEGRPMKKLWPWPMEDRIFTETGVSVTWEANEGLWRTLNGVYKE